MNRSKILMFGDEVIELMENGLLNHRPFLVKLTGWNEYHDFRASKEDLESLANFILSFIEGNTDD